MFKTTDIGACTYFVRIKVENRTSGLIFSPSAYKETIMSTEGMKECKSTGSPLAMFHPLYEPLESRSDAEKEAMKSVSYKEILGMLLFLSTRTRPDLATAVSMLGKFRSTGTMKNWREMKCVLRYLRGTSDYGIFLQND